MADRVTPLFYRYLVTPDFATLVGAAVPNWFAEGVEVSDHEREMTLFASDNQHPTIATHRFCSAALALWCGISCYICMHIHTYINSS